MQFNVETIKIYSDLALRMNEVNGIFTATNPVMSAYLDKVKNLTKNFKKVEVKQLPREQNYHVRSRLFRSNSYHKKYHHRKANPILFKMETYQQIHQRLEKS